MSSRRVFGLLIDRLINLAETGVRGQAPVTVLLRRATARKTCVVFASRAGRLRPLAASAPLSNQPGYPGGIAARTESRVPRRVENAVRRSVEVHDAGQRHGLRDPADGAAVGAVLRPDELDLFASGQHEREHLGRRPQGRAGQREQADARHRRGPHPLGRRRRLGGPAVPGHRRRARSDQQQLQVRHAGRPRSDHARRRARPHHPGLAERSCAGRARRSSTSSRSSASAKAATPRSASATCSNSTTTRSRSSASATFSARSSAVPYVYTTYDRAVSGYAYKSRKMLTFVLAEPAQGLTAEVVARRIEKETGLKAYTNRRISRWSTMRWFFKNTGIPAVMGLTVFIGLVVGMAISAQTFYSFVLENTRFLGALKAMGTPTPTLCKMLMFQSVAVGLIGYGIGIGITVAFGRMAISTRTIPYAMPWQVPAISARHRAADQRCRRARRHPANRASRARHRVPRMSGADRGSGRRHRRAHAAASTSFSAKAMRARRCSRPLTSARRSASLVMLVGPSGCGKTTLAVGARRHASIPTPAKSACSANASTR
jgi:hypothetical protein